MAWSAGRCKRRGQDHGLAPAARRLVGGDSARGPLLGVAVLVLLSELLWIEAPQYYLIILGCLMVLFVIKLPSGLLGWFEDRQSRRRRMQESQA